MELSAGRLSAAASSGTLRSAVTAAPAWIVTSLAGGAILEFLILIATRSNPDLAAALASSTIVLMLIGLFMASRPSITHLTFVFMAEGIIYLIVEPWLVASGIAWVVGGQFMKGNYRLLTLGNEYVIIGLLSYGIGAACAAAFPRELRGRELLRPLDNKRVVFILLVVAGLSWLMLFVRAGMPKEALLLIRSPKIIRNQSFVAGGWGYLLSAALSASVAMLVYVIGNPRKPLLSAPMAGLTLCMLLFNGLWGSRLVFAMAPFGVLMLQQLLSRRDRTLRPSLGTVGVAITAAGLLFVALVYTEYRGLAESNATVASIDWKQSVALDAGTMTDTAITYYMVLARVPQYYDYWHGRGFLFPLLATVPRFIFPNKYDVAMGHREFVEQFYGYDEWGMGKNATGCSLMAEAFLNFGIPGVVGVFLILGWVNERLGTWAHSSNTTNFFSVMYIYYICYATPNLWKSGFGGLWNFTQMPFAIFVIVSVLSSSIPRSQRNLDSVASAQV